MDRRTFLRGTVGLAVAGALGALDPIAAGAARRSPPPTIPPTLAPLPPASWPPKPEAFPGLIADRIVAENAKAGSAAWRIGLVEPAGAQATAKGGRPAQAIEGYLDTTSATIGQRIAFRVSSVTPTYTIEAYRMGWYGANGGRLVWQSGPLPGWQQGAPHFDADTNMAEAGWDVTFELMLDSPPFLPGCYLFKLTTADGRSRLVPLTVRDDSSQSRYLLVNAVNDWQAYNEWGGASLYYGEHGRSRDYGARARVVSFDRPYDWGLGAADFIGGELPLIMRLEEAGLDVSYATSIDVHSRPDLLLDHMTLISTAHDEYWTKEMRDAFENARDKGVNLVFCGANAIYRQVRLTDSPHGKLRREVCYKSASEDPTSRTNPKLTTVNWRDSPVNEPEAPLIGIEYDGQGIADLEINNPGGWIWQDTGVGYRQKLRGVVGPEFDRVASSSPKNIEVFARSAIVEKSDRDTFADVAYYSAPSGAGVFATGTIGWISRLDTIPGNAQPQEPIIYQATMNVLRLFGDGPAGKTRPSVGNSSSISPSPLPKKPAPKRPTVPSPTPTPPTTAAPGLPIP